MSEIKEVIHPGILLKEAWVNKEKITIQKAADILGVKRRRLSEVLNGHVPISPELSERIARHLGTVPADYLAQQQAFKESKKFQKPVKYKSIKKQAYYESWKALEITEEK